MSSLTVARWEQSFELALDGEVVTQSHTLAGAAQQVRDYLDTIDPSIDHSDWAVTMLEDGGEAA
ncbi:hypothetical protein [Brachybacterium paraconglomeratum]|uniref:hypothetical protein n=1 Tax=Brachybacterium paraconglomeratum TaxID=173362 RepID=UPI003F7B64BC